MIHYGRYIMPLSPITAAKVKVVIMFSSYASNAKWAGLAIDKNYDD